MCRKSMTCGSADPEGGLCMPRWGRCDSAHSFPDAPPPTHTHASTSPPAWLPLLSSRASPWFPCPVDRNWAAHHLPRHVGEGGLSGLLLAYTVSSHTHTWNKWTYVCIMSVVTRWVLSFKKRDGGKRMGRESEKIKTQKWELVNSVWAGSLKPPSQNTGACLFQFQRVQWNALWTRCSP